jgi:epoxyqueuosine reductase
MKDLLSLSAADLTRWGIVDWGYTETLTAHSYQTYCDWLDSCPPALSYLQRDDALEKRRSLLLWEPQAQAALVFLFDYTACKKALLESASPRVASYSLGFNGDDYHDVLPPVLHLLAKQLGFAKDSYRLCLDTQPVLERDLAWRAGLGWIGKNSMLIHPKHGSYFLIGSLVLRQKLDLTSSPQQLDHCGNCNACVEACPTLAIDATTRTLKAAQCISTWSIEDRSEVTRAPDGLENSRGEVFGCDICQDVCPWNRKPLERVVGFLGQKAEVWRQWYHRSYSEILAELGTLSERGFQRLTRGTPFGRPTKKALERILRYWTTSAP